MSEKDPTFERIGVNAVEAIFLNEFGWLFREQAVSDYGLDAQVEVVENNEPTGRLFGLQIKTGSSYFRPRGNDFVFYGELRHLEYWARHSLPVFLVLHDPEKNLTLWQKVERRLANVTEKGWSIVVPGGNVLNASAKTFIVDGIAADDESIRRFNMAFDLDTMEMLNDREVYFEVNEWVNKSLRFRDVGVFFDEYGKDKPDFMIRMWVAALTLHEFMSKTFPWLGYDHVGTEEALAGEVEVHTLEVWVNDIGTGYLRVEDYFKNGLPDVPEDKFLDYEPPEGDDE
jgi:hypothetical protein